MTSLEYNSLVSDNKLDAIGAAKHWYNSFKFILGDKLQFPDFDELMLSIGSDDIMIDLRYKMIDENGWITVDKYTDKMMGMMATYEIAPDSLDEFVTSGFQDIVNTRWAVAEPDIKKRPYIPDEIFTMFEQVIINPFIPIVNRPKIGKDRLRWCELQSLRAVAFGWIWHRGFLRGEPIGSYKGTWKLRNGYIQSHMYQDIVSPDDASIPLLLVFSVTNVSPIVDAIKNSTFGWAGAEKVPDMHVKFPVLMSRHHPYYEQSKSLRIKIGALRFINIILGNKHVNNAKLIIEDTSNQQPLYELNFRATVVDQVGWKAEDEIISEVCSGEADLIEELVPVPGGTLHQEVLDPILPEDEQNFIIKPFSEYKP